MKILAIDSSGLVASVAVTDGDSLIAEFTVNYKKTHSETLMPMIETMVNEIGLDLNTLDAIAISNGPGSFTGLRIGSATAKGLAFALSKPVVEISSIEGMAYNFYGTTSRICPIMDARRGEVYTGIYTFAPTESKPFSYRLETILEPVPMALDSLIEKLNEDDTPVIFTGDGIDVHRENILAKANIPVSFAPSMQSRQRASLIAYAADNAYKAGKYVSAADSSPVYLRVSQAEREREEKALK